MENVYTCWKTSNLPINLFEILEFKTYIFLLGGFMLVSKCCFFPNFSEGTTRLQSERDGEKEKDTSQKLL